MVTDSKEQKLPLPLSTLKRPQYEAGHYLAARDLLTEQRYRWQRLRRHNRYLHGWGVVCGLFVVPAQDHRRPWAVQVCPGYAIGPYGDEMEVRTPAVVVDIRDYLWRRSQEHEGSAHMAYVGIRYDEQEVQPIPITPPTCGCAAPTYEPSRLRDSFQVGVLWAFPEVDTDEGFDLCSRGMAPCPVCPESPYVILAGVTLPASENTPITRDDIDNFVRR